MITQRLAVKARRAALAANDARAVVGAPFGAFIGALADVLANASANVFTAVFTGALADAVVRIAALAASLCAMAAAQPAIAATPPAAAAAETAARPVIVVLGDSLSAEYGLPRDTGWVALMRQRLASERIDYSVANASISGDTTSGGLARLPLVMQRLKPSIVIVELGANDALRGVPLATTESNLRAIVGQIRKGNARPMLVGMYVPPNYGADYTQRFHGLYGRLSRELHTPLVPFLLAGLADKPELFQSDQIHPTQQAQPLLLDNVWPTLKPLLGGGAQR